MRRTRRNRLCQRQLPTRRRLMRQPSNQIDIDIRNPRSAQPRNVFEHRTRACANAPPPQPPHPQTTARPGSRDSPRSAAALDHLVAERSRRAFNRDLRPGGDIKFRPHRGKHALQLSSLQHGRRPATQINRIHSAIKPPAHLLWQISSRSQYRRKGAPHTFKHRLGKHVGREVAVAALGPAERARKCRFPETQLIIPLRRSSGFRAQDVTARAYGPILLARCALAPAP